MISYFFVGKKSRYVNHIVPDFQIIATPHGSGHGRCETGDGEICKLVIRSNWKRNKECMPSYILWTISQSPEMVSPFDGS
jgi:hypothetical protein